MLSKEESLLLELTFSLGLANCYLRTERRRAPENKKTKQNETPNCWLWNRDLAKFILILQFCVAQSDT